VRITQFIVLAALSLSACGGGGSPAAQRSRPVISSFKAIPSFVTSGQDSTLTWSVAGATSLRISGIGTVAGSSIAVKPAADTDYALTATNDFGSTTAHVSVAVFAPPTVWFAPIGATQAIPEVQGAVDYLDLFSPTAAWANAAGHVTVFKLYSDMLFLDDATLRNMFADLRRRHIAFAIEWGPLDQPDGSCGEGLEGFEGSRALEFAQRIQDLGGSLQYVAFDEPFANAWRTDGPNACGWTPDQVAENAAQHVARIKTIFPDVIVGDIEPVSGASGLLDAYQAWMNAWKRVTGSPFAFFHCDVDWGSDYKPAVALLARYLKREHIAFGMLYTGGAAASSADWVNAAESFYTDYEIRGGTVPDEVVFQSWMPFPKHVLPETDPTTLTHLIDTYYRDRTTLTSSATATLATGRLTLTDSGSAIAAAPIEVKVAPVYGTGQPSVYTSTVTSIPPGTTFIEFGARVNTECTWIQRADFFLTGFRLDAGPAGILGEDFTNGLNGWGLSGDAVVQVTNASLRVSAAPDEWMILNGGAMPFTPTGAPVTFSVNATIPAGARSRACAVLMFEREGNAETGRVTIPLAPQPSEVGTVQTAADGTFALNLGASLPTDYELWSDYAGSATLWPASAAIAVGSLPPLSVNTVSLPSGTVGAVYSAALSASGGLTPYLWVGTGLPPGLTQHSDGTLTGTPTAAGTYTVRLSVVDDSTPIQIIDVSLPLVIQ
jgi:hypothetical protein